MDKTEIIFFAIAIMAYAICALTMNIPLIIDLVFAILLLVIFALILIQNYKTRFENENISKIFNILSLISLILYIITAILEITFGKSVLINSGIFILVFIPLFIISWFFEKKED